MKDIPGFGGRYAVTEDGRIWSKLYKGKTKGRYLVPFKNKFGYTEITLYRLATKHTYKVHRLVALSYLPNTENHPQVNHKNGIKHDNRLCNLEWCSRAANMKHASDIGLLDGRTDGQRNPQAKLSDDQVINIRHLAKTGLPVTEIARTNNISISNAYLIIRGHTWKHLPL